MRAFASRFEPATVALGVVRSVRLEVHTHPVEVYILDIRICNLLTYRDAHHAHHAGMVKWFMLRMFPVFDVRGPKAVTLKRHSSPYAIRAAPTS